MLQIKALLLCSLNAVSLGCSPLFECDNEIIERKDNGKGLLAVAFERNCGATASSSYHVSILPDGEEFGDELTGDIYITDDSDLKIDWISPRELRITTGSDPISSFQMKQRVMGVDIEYRTDDQAFRHDQ